jgi:uncharacterized membrane protein YjfL (UPF0719 family)
MSGDEGMVLVLCMFVAGIAWAAWFWQATFTAPRCSRFEHRWPLLLAPAVCAGVLYAVLKTFSSFDVRDDPVYQGFYMVLGAAWIGVAAWFLPYLGLSPRDDVIERANPGAARAIGGALLGIALCFAGANIGDGPGWWVVFFSAFLATAVLFLFWIFLDKATGLADTLTIDRDRAAGLRVAGLFIGAGLILGRAVAGDWESAMGTVVDFVKTGWPLGVLGLVAAGLEKQLRPSPERPEPPLATHGLAPFALYLGIAAFFTAWAGWWN